MAIYVALNSTILRINPFCREHPKKFGMLAVLPGEYLGQRVEQIEKLAGEGIGFCVFGVRRDRFSIVKVRVVI